MKKNIKSIGLDDPEKLYQFIERHLAPKDYEKKEFGEVFTPLWLVEQMLNKVPRKVWHDPQTKILDPAAGIGNFPIIAYKKLMEGLKDHIKDDNKRKRHILENMLYMVELNPVNSAIMKRLLGGNTLRKKDGYDLNIVTSSFFDKELITKNKKIDLSTIKYTLIMGNPPYSEGSGNIGNSIWQKFVRDSILLIKEKGFLSFVHPPSWRKPEKPDSSNLYNLLAYDRTPLYIEMHDAYDGRKTFNSGTRYDWYIIKNTPNIGYQSGVKDITGKKHYLQLNKYYWLPNQNFTNIFKLMNKYNNSNVIHDSSYGTERKWTSDKKTNVFKYTIVNSTTKNGITCMYSSKNNLGHFGISKVIFGESGINDPIIDINGSYGMTQGAIGIPVKNKLDGIKLTNFLKSEYFTDILKSCLWANYRIEWILFAYFKDGFWRSYNTTTDKFIDKPILCMQRKIIKK